MSQSSKNKETLKEYGRGIIGGLLFSLPLIYTMEVWWTGFIAPTGYLICCIFITFLLLLGFNTFAGMRKDSSFWEVCWDSVEEIGLAFIVSFLFLLLIRRVGFGMSLDEIAGKVIVESMVVAIGISVGTAQLGGGGGGEENSGMSGENEDDTSGTDDSIWKILVLSICGAVLFASSVAPTQEILQIAVESSNIHLLFMVIVSLLLNSVILYFSNFMGTSKIKLSTKKMILYILVTYLAALLVSFFFLWFFGRVDGKSLYIVIAQMIVLAIPGSIGAAAGRLLIAR